MGPFFFILSVSCGPFGTLVFSSQESQHLKTVILVNDSENEGSWVETRIIYQCTARESWDVCVVCPLCSSHHTIHTHHIVPDVVCRRIK